jgi:hypothetical protein
LVVWDDDPNHLLSRAQSIEDQLVSVIWKSELEGNEKPGTPIPNRVARYANSLITKEQSASQKGIDEESAVEPRRETVLVHPVLMACTLILVLVVIGRGWREIAMEIKIDQGWIRLAFLAVVPMQIWLALVSSDVKITNSELTLVVLHANTGVLRRPNLGPRRSDEGEHQDLLWKSSDSS